MLRMLQEDAHLNGGGWLLSAIPSTLRLMLKQDRFSLTWSMPMQQMTGMLEMMVKWSDFCPRL